VVNDAIQMHVYEGPGGGYGGVSLCFWIGAILCAISFGGGIFLALLDKRADMVDKENAVKVIHQCTLLISKGRRK
jgi:hypothetical protein